MESGPSWLTKEIYFNGLKTMGSGKGRQNIVISWNSFNKFLIEFVRYNYDYDENKCIFGETASF